jgi:6-phosphogluconolactonase
MAIDADVRVLLDADQVARTAAVLFVDAAKSAGQGRHGFHVCLAGGSTPRATYALLATEFTRDIPWAQLRVFFGDERCVPPDHADSNYRMAADTLLRHSPVSPDRVHRIPAERGAVPAAEEYERTLRAHLRGPDGRFDLVFLGLGEDGHTASLFPGTAALHVRDRWCVSSVAPKTGLDRVTLTYPILNAARRIVFLVTGAGKSRALRSVLVDPIDIARCPAQGIRPDGGELIWLTDRAAAAALPAENGVHPPPASSPT